LQLRLGRVSGLCRKGPIEGGNRIDRLLLVSDEYPELLLEGLVAKGAQHLYVDVGQTIQSFLKIGLISS
jgi:hypothetical protein